jgi:hypothetical protein
MTSDEEFMAAETAAGRQYVGGPVPHDAAEPNHARVENEPSVPEKPVDWAESVRLTQTRYIRRRKAAGRWTRMSAFLLVGASFSVMVATFAGDEDPEPFDVDAELPIGYGPR